MLTIAQATSFSDNLKKVGLHKDAAHVDKYVLLASNLPIEKHAGLWDWVGGKLSGWSKRIFFKSFRQAYALAKEIQKELDDQMERVNEQYEQVEMYLNRHDLPNWQKTIAEMGINLTPTDRLANLQERYNDSLQEMNKGIGLLSGDQLKELKEEQKKQREPATTPSTPATPETGETTAPVTESATVSNTPDVGTPEEPSQTPVTEGDLSEEEKAKIVDETDARIPRKYDSPGETNWNNVKGTPFYESIKASNPPLFAMPLEEFKIGVLPKNAWVKRKQRNDGALYFKADPGKGRNIPATWKRMFTDDPKLYYVVYDPKFEGEDGNYWMTFAKTDFTEIEDVAMPPEDTKKIRNTAGIYMSEDENTIFLQRKEFEEVKEKEGIKIGPKGQHGDNVIFGHFDIPNIPNDWQFAFRKRLSKMWRFDLHSDVSPEWVKVSAANRSDERQDRRLTEEPQATPVAPEETTEVELGDINVPETGKESKTAKRLDKIIALAMMT